MHVDLAYNRLAKVVLMSGLYYKDTSRDNIRLLQIPHYTLHIDVSDSFPLLTTKRVFWKTVIHELIWMLSGSEYIDYLRKNNVKIWDADVTNFSGSESTYAGRIYGAQWRAWMDIFGSTTIDQIANLIKNLKENLWTRRHIVTAWNPAELDNMALPPCHWSFEILPVSNDSFTLKWHQRSCDVFLGIPFDIALYAALGKLIGLETGLKCVSLIGDLSCVHFYEPHIPLIREQLQKPFKEKPGDLIIADDYDFNNLSIDDFEVENYKPHKAIKAKMYSKKI